MNMKPTLVIIYMFFLVSVSWGQGKEDEKLSIIKDQIEVIDNYIKFETFYLDPEEFLDKMEDHGSQLEGYYEHERLKKIVKKIGKPTADVVTTYYLWNDQLIYVNYQQRSYFESKDANGNRVMDYSRTSTNYESKYYYDNGTQIKTEKIGEPLKEIQPEDKFFAYVEKIKFLLDNKYYNKEVYEKLQGKWVFVDNSEDYIIFNGTIRFNFYNGKFANRLKTRMEEGVLVCFFPKDDRIYRYKIESITENGLTLIDISSLTEFLYFKLE